MREYFVYILASAPFGTLYIGVTSDLQRRVFEHKNDVREGFTKRYGVHMIVYYELTNRVDEAIKRERQLKHLNRDRKIALIRSRNPFWKDLWADGVVLPLPIAG